MNLCDNPVFRINEIFYSIAGEGGRAGEPTIFVRLSGCNLQCPWCDQADHPTIRHRWTASDLVTRLREAGWPARWICLTGGEPMMQDAPAIARALQASGYRVHLETNGTYPIPDGAFDYVTVSPKMQGDVLHDRWPFLPQNEAVADEFKYVISNHADLECVRWGRRIFLQPNAECPDSVRICTDAVLNNPEWRISLQVHKLLGLP